MITPIPVALGSAAATKKASSVTVSLGETSNGRIPVTVVVVPLEDLDVTAVYVDFRLGSKDPTEAYETKTPGENHSATITKGNEAIAALAKAEADFSNESPAIDPKTPAVTKPAPKIDVAETTAQMHKAAPVVAGAKPSRQEGKRPLISHQIGQAHKLTLGQAETFRADVTAPNEAAADGTHWYVRGRFSAGEGRDLRSAWLRV